MFKTAFIIVVLCLVLQSLTAQDGLVAYTSSSSRLAKDSSLPLQKKMAIREGLNLDITLESKKPSKSVLGYTKNNRPIEVFYFPGISNKKAMVIGGMHGSELSSVEVAHRILKELSKGGMPYYNVIIVPCLFPDNAAVAKQVGGIRVENNSGRYSHDHAVDPNRQMPALGKAFDSEEPVDANGRTIERENQLLLQLIQLYLPDRIVNLHAIKDLSKAGIYADPRTDCNGIAQGFSSDSALAVKMAQFVQLNGGLIPGNHLNAKPTALYFNDPYIAQAGELQKRNLEGSQLPNQRGQGASLGSWASTAVCDEELQHYRSAIRLITVEFPGYKKPVEYKTIAEQKKYNHLADIYAAAIVNYFLGEFFVENTAENPVVSK